jgi:hypothetical protein
MMPKNSSKKSVRKRSRRSARVAKPARVAVPSLASLPLEAITAELKRRQSEIPKLEARAKALRNELAAVEARIATLSGAVAARPTAAKPTKPGKSANPAKSPSARFLRKRRDGQPTLAERIVALLSGGGAPRSPRDIAEAIAPAIGREVNQSFLVQISLTLRKLVNAGHISQPARAQYAAASAKGGAPDAAN